MKLLDQMRVFFGEDRKISVSRELTKLHEETITDTVTAVLSYFTNKGVKGEFVVVIEGKT